MQHFLVRKLDLSAGVFYRQCADVHGCIELHCGIPNICRCTYCAMRDRTFFPIFRVAFVYPHSNFLYFRNAGP